MKTNRLGRSNLRVSALCLGSMTWGSQNDEGEAHDQIDLALDHGINFIDTAEMYPTTPRSKETAGHTEAFIGSWFAKTGRRDAVVLATKIIGNGDSIIRDGAPITPQSLTTALDGSLKRLRTDYIDLYQLHWPNRGSYHFRKHWRYEPWEQEKRVADDLLSTLEALDGFIKAGKIREIGLSNDTAWGVMQFLALAEARGLPRIASIQNEYSLLCRLFDTDLAELSHHEDVGLLSYSPLAAGLLTGKYSGDVTPEGSRRSINPTLGGRIGARAHQAVDAYAAIAREFDLDLTQMSLAWCMSRPFMASTIFGATSLAQLRTCLGAAELTLAPQVLEAIDAAHRSHPMPF
ncbi:MAG: aldo/keto reductase [Neomegalonema sp.]|nr:aldo/keto reductase [Neomegalonema sp.]